MTLPANSVVECDQETVTKRSRSMKPDIKIKTVHHVTLCGCQEHTSC